ncbi:Slp family lipoprotein [Nitrosomonas communis]|uniref:Slp family lipoprotein n=1 Tax=Nitrosomonas communis TaxID=44574 RepID=UPI0026EA40BA|nr:Slp family lipoprotein [Nitrosomonas communis]MCO6427326.1 Slp family lipoprotein [Nitrosomonas communis]
MKTYLSIISLLVLLGGCTSLPPAIKDFPVTNVPYHTLSQNIEAYKDTPLRWGGVIIDVENEKDFTLVQVLFYPLDYKGYPQLNKESEGRFVIESSEFLDPAVYAKDSEITVAGTLKGDIERTIGNKIIRVPLISATAIYLWPKDYRYYYYGPGRYSYPPYPYSGYYYGYPFFFRGYYGPYRYWW